MATISIDLQKCNGCGSCVTACPNGVYELEDGKVYKGAEARCEPMDCVKCVYACRQKALQFHY